MVFSKPIPSSKSGSLVAQFICHCLPSFVTENDTTCCGWPLADGLHNMQKRRDLLTSLVTAVQQNPWMEGVRSCVFCFTAAASVESRPVICHLSFLTSTSKVGKCYRQVGNRVSLWRVRSCARDFFWCRRVICCNENMKRCKSMTHGQNGKMKKNMGTEQKKHGNSRQVQVLTCGHFSPCRRMSRSRVTRHRRSFQAPVSLCDVSPHRAAGRQPAQASAATFGMCVPDLARRVVPRIGRRHCRGKQEGTVGQLLVEDLAFQKPGGLHLNRSLEALFRGPVLSLFPMAKRAARSW